jgi:hypothetical protein
LDLPPHQAADALELSPEDYEADEKYEVLLLKKCLQDSLLRR